MPILTITYPNENRALLSLAELQSAASGYTISDANLTALGNYVSAAITRLCKVVAAGATPPTLREEGVMERFRLKSRQGYLALARKPVVEINSVTENDLVLSASEYELDGNLIYKMSGDYRCGWPCGEVEIDYTAGYEVVPDDLKWAAIKYVQAELTNDGAPSQDPTLKRRKIEGVSEYEWWVDPAKDNSVPSDVMSILEAGGYIRKFGWLS